MRKLNSTYKFSKPLKTAKKGGELCGQGIKTQLRKDIRKVQGLLKQGCEEQSLKET